MNEDKDMTGTKLNTRSGRSLVGIAAAAAIAAAGGCSSSGGSTPSSSTSKPTVSSSTSSMSTSSSPSTSTSTDPLAKKKAAAIAAVVALFKKIDQLQSNPRSDITSLDVVARGQELAQWQANITSNHYKGYSGRGHSQIVGPVASATRDPLTYDVKACLDVSKFQLLEKSGKPVPIPSGAPRRVAYTYGVTQDAKTLKWYVTTEKATGTC